MQNIQSNFCCPICKATLDIENNSLHCVNNHSFDISKSGYVNLLPSSKMHSKMPGDNKLMVDTRNKFLSKGYYNALKEELCIQIVDTAKAVGGESIRLLDAGCGEGYYTQAMQQALLASKLSTKFSILGVDISKLALNIAAKRAKQVMTGAAEFATAEYAVGSVFDLPVADKSCDIVTELFAPYSGSEFYRVLKPRGVLLLVIPSTEHLYELKQAIYEKPYKNEVKDYSLEGFELINKTEIRSEILIDNNEDIKNLFTMTPYYYKTSKEDTERLNLLDSLKTTIHFEILAYICSVI